MPVLYTVGYGGRTPKELTKLLKGASINLMIDVRRAQSRAFIRPFDTGTNMEVTLAKAKPPIGYEYPGGLGNNYNTGDTQEDLRIYKEGLDDKTGRDLIRYWAEWILEGCDYFHKDVVVNYCLLCSEKNAYWEYPPVGIDVGAVKCHRVYVADALVKVMSSGLYAAAYGSGNGEWEVEHL